MTNTGPAAAGGVTPMDNAAAGGAGGVRERPVHRRGGGGAVVQPAVAECADGGRAIGNRRWAGVTVLVTLRLLRWPAHQQRPHQRPRPGGPEHGQRDGERHDSGAVAGSPLSPRQEWGVRRSLFYGPGWESRRSTALTHAAAVERRTLNLELRIAGGAGR
ncbi:MAG: hypothetical protein U0531_01135 [Dehalococcoidia bacterium]